jgi:hypothetical protein
MMLSRTEREQRVIELHGQGKTIREIAQEVHMSFGDIGAIIRKATRPEEDNNNNSPLATLSKDSQAFALFSDGKKPTDVAIKLEIGADVVDRLYQQFWRLQGLYQLNQVYKEIRRYLPSFLKLFKIMKQQRMMSEQDVVDALRFAKELPHLKDQFQLLAEEINSLEYKKNSLRAVLSALQNQINTTRNSLKLYQSAVDEKIENIADMHRKLARLENIKNNSKDYQKIEKVAEQKANEILANKKAVVLAAVISVLGALRDHPNKQQLLIYDSFYPSNNNSTADIFAKMMPSSPTANQESYPPLSFHHKEILNIAEGLYDQLLKVAINNTIYPSSHQANPQRNAIKIKN